jgi:hypothetical protein
MYLCYTRCMYSNSESEPAPPPLLGQDGPAACRGQGGRGGHGQEGGAHTRQAAPGLQGLYPAQGKGLGLHPILPRVRGLQDLHPSQG